MKRFLSVRLRDLHFQAVPAGEHTLPVIHYLAELSGSKKRILDDISEQIITGPWTRLVCDSEGQIQRAGYISALQVTVDKIAWRQAGLVTSFPSPTDEAGTLEVLPGQ